MEVLPPKLEESANQSSPNGVTADQDGSESPPVSQEGTAAGTAIDRDPVERQQQPENGQNLTNPCCQADQGYGSTESSFNGQSRKSSYSGGGSLTKSRNSGSSQSSGFGEQHKKDAHTASLTSSDKDSATRAPHIDAQHSNDGNTEELTENLAAISCKSKSSSAGVEKLHDGAHYGSSTPREKRTKEQKLRDFKRKKVEDGHYQSYDGFPRPLESYSFASAAARASDLPDKHVEDFTAPLISLQAQKDEFREPLRNFSGLSCSKNDYTVGSKALCLQAASLPSSSGVKRSLDQSVAPAAQQSFFSQCAASTSYTVSSSCRVKSEIAEQPTMIYTQALNYIRRIKEGFTNKGQVFQTPEREHLSSNQSEAIADFIKSFGSNRKGFTMVLSIRDGTIIRVSTNIAEVLGFPEDMVVGHSFIDFVYPRDSVHFSSKIVSGMSLLTSNSSTRADSLVPPFYCRVRENKYYQASAFDMRGKNSYKPCKITLKFNDTLTPLEEEVMAPISPFHLPTPDVLLAEVIPVPSFYQVPDEVINGGNFVIRHSASCNFSEYDPDAIPFLGHLPQDLTGNSIFDCYHPEDLPLLLTIYREIIREEGKPFRSESYRFRTFNGSWVVLETEWLCFVNPWTRKIDSIIGQHKVVKGPRDISIYMEQCEGSLSTYSEEVCIVARKARREIIDLLSRPVAASLAEVLRHETRHPTVSPMQHENCVGIKVPASKRKRTLAEMMSCLVNDIHAQGMKNMTSAAKISALPTSGICTSTSTAVTTSSAAINNSMAVQTNAPVRNAVEPSASTAAPQAAKGESLLSSSESPSTYSRLNYSATMLRFFQSNPRTASTDASAESKMESSIRGSVDEAKSSSPKQQYCKFSSSVPSGVNKSLYMSGYGSGSGDTIYLTRKYGSKDVTDSGSGESASGPSSASGGAGSANYRHVPLTEEVLSRHNQEMQMLFMERQKKNTVAITTPSRQRERLSRQKLKQVKKAARKPASKCAMKRPNSGSQRGDNRAHKFPFIEKVSPKQSEQTGPSHLPGPMHTNHGNKLPINSFHRSGSRADQVTGRTDLAVPVNPATCSSEQPQAPYFFPGHPLPTHSNGFQNTSLPSNPSTSLSQEPQLSANPHPYPITPVMMGPHQTHFMTPQGLGLPLHYMGAYPGMYIPHPSFNQAMYGAGPLMMSNIMMPHPFIQQSTSTDPLHVSPTNLNTSSRQADNQSYIAQVVPAERSSQSLQQRHTDHHHTHTHHQQQAQLQQPLPHLKSPHGVVHLRKRSDSRATSVKVEPGSVRGSVASASGQLRCSMSHRPESLRSETDEPGNADQGLVYVPRVASHASHFSRSTSVLGEAESIASPDKRPSGMEDHHAESSSDMVMSDSSPAQDSMPMLSEFSVDTSESIGVIQPPCDDRPVLHDPAWLDHIEVTPQLLFRYQLHTKELVDVLKNDMAALKTLNQPALVEDQLSSLYQELEIDGEQLQLDEGITSSSGEEMLDASTKTSSEAGAEREAKKARSSRYFDKQAILHEVEAAIPPPHLSISHRSPYSLTRRPLNKHKSS
ncbi:Period circadian-like C-terminal [Trinorchestia longiramus]|nr:Period circadian-like C-terminal [Trinorchestia longiramus]